VEPHLLRPSAIDLPVVALDAAKLRKDIGWAPAHSATEMLSSLLDYWREVEAQRASA
jgi:hypothetical protein